MKIGIDTQHATIVQLRQALSRYGLDPSEWLVIPQQENRYRIVNLKDHSFQFSGISGQSPEPSWGNISLFSL